MPFCYEPIMIASYLLLCFLTGLMKSSAVSVAIRMKLSSDIPDPAPPKNELRKLLRRECPRLAVGIGDFVPCLIEGELLLNSPPFSSSEDEFGLGDFGRGDLSILRNTCGGVAHLLRT